MKRSLTEPDESDTLAQLARCDAIVARRGSTTIYTIDNHLRVTHRDGSEICVTRNLHTGYESIGPWVDACFFLPERDDRGIYFAAETEKRIKRDRKSRGVRSQSTGPRMRVSRMPRIL